MTCDRSGDFAVSVEEDASHLHVVCSAYQLPSQRRLEAAKSSSGSARTTCPTQVPPADLFQIRGTL